MAEAPLPRSARIVGALAFAAGCVFRALYVLYWHRPKDFLVSDMEFYVRTAREWLDPAHVGTINDTMYPPGTSYLLALLLRIDPSLTAAAIAMLLIACAIPLVVWGIGRDLFGAKVALVALVVSSAFYPLFDYSGYFLAENPFTLLLLVSFFLLARSLHAGGRARFVYASLSGIVLGLAVSFKSVALASGVFVVATLLARRGEERRRAVPLVLTAALGLALVLVPLCIRATRLNEGRFCLVANETARGFLLGHHGELYKATFTDHKRGYFYEYGNNTARQRGRTEELHLDVGPWDNGEILAEAWTWTRAHPGQALVLSFEHVHEIFVAIPWPSGEYPRTRPWAIVFQRGFFQVFILVPALVHLVWIGRKKNGRAVGFADLLVAAPIFGVMLGAFLSVGESRYRVPFDGFTILLAARAYTRLGAWLSRWRSARGAAAGSS
jgi:4-amino-4-deoxy-L-arabinose transferase-like glycosyltransferase